MLYGLLNVRADNSNTTHHSQARSLFKAPCLCFMILDVLCSLYSHFSNFVEYYTSPWPVIYNIRP